MKGLEERINKIEEMMGELLRQIEEMKKPSYDFPRLYDTSDVADVLRVSPACVRKLNRDGLLKNSGMFHEKKKGYTKEDINTYLNEYFFKPAVVMKEHVEQALSA